jgi:hypothetical protein
MIASKAQKDKVRVVYGSDNWRPSFWLENMWGWTNLSKSNRRYTEAMYTGEGSLSEFLDKTISYYGQEKFGH